MCVQHRERKILKKNNNKILKEIQVWSFVMNAQSAKKEEKKIGKKENVTFDMENVNKNKRESEEREEE